MPDTVYGWNSRNKCKREVYSKDQIDEMMPVVRYGTTAPDNSVGKDGDIYIKIEEQRGE